MSSGIGWASEWPRSVNRIVASTCLTCRHFNDAPAALEAALPGLSSLSSAYAAVRLSDGICAMHDRYVSAASACARYAA
jgi:hypothetical protein